MANQLLTIVHKNSGVLTDYDSLPLLRSQDGTFGVKEFVSGTAVVAASTPFIKASTGAYTYDIIGVVVGRVYVYAVQRTFNGATSWVQKVFTPDGNTGILVPNHVSTARAAVTSLYLDKTYLSTPQNSAPTFTFACVDQNGDPIDLTGDTVRFVAFTNTILPAAQFKRETGGNGIVLGGTGNNEAAVTLTTGNTTTAQSLQFALWNVTASALLAEGVLDVQPMPIDFP